MSKYGTKVIEIIDQKFNGVDNAMTRTLAESVIEKTMYAEFPRYVAGGSVSEDYAKYEAEQGGFTSILGGVNPYDYF